MNHSYHRTPQAADGARRLSFFGLPEVVGLFVDGVLAASYAAQAETGVYTVNVHERGSSTPSRQIVAADEATAQRLCRETAGLPAETPLPAWAQDVLGTLEAGR
jgi:hypothetical protein